jgi:ankyrin repeat protein
MTIINLPLELIDTISKYFTSEIFTYLTIEIDDSIYDSIYNFLIISNTEYTEKILMRNRLDQLVIDNELTKIRYMVEYCGFFGKKELKSILIFACKFNRLNIVEYVVSNGVDISAYNNCAIIIAIRMDHFNIVKYLVEQGQDITINENYPVRFAYEFNRLNIVKYLVEQGADITAVDNYAIKMAKIYGYFELMEYLIEILKSMGIDQNSIDFGKCEYCFYCSINYGELMCSRCERFICHECVGNYSDICTCCLRPTHYDMFIHDI